MDGSELGCHRVSLHAFGRHRLDWAGMAGTEPGNGSERRMSAVGDGIVVHFSVFIYRVWSCRLGQSLLLGMHGRLKNLDRTQNAYPRRVVSCLLIKMYSLIL